MKRRVSLLVGAALIAATVLSLTACSSYSGGTSRGYVSVHHGYGYGPGWGYGFRGGGYYPPPVIVAPPPVIHVPSRPVVTPF